MGDFHDELKIISDDNFTQLVKLHAIQSQAQILFEPFVNLGFVQVGKTKVNQRGEIIERKRRFTSRTRGRSWVKWSSCRTKDRRKCSSSPACSK